MKAPRVASAVVSLTLSALFGLLVSCGGGVGSGGTGGFSGTQIGAITGFGSVIVEGNTYSDSNTSYVNGKNPASLRTVTSDAARLGMQVELSFATSSAGEQAQVVYIRPNLIGTIESLSGNSVVVAGQKIILQSSPAAATVFENFAQLTHLSVGNSVEVHGSRNAAEELVASRIELLDSVASTETRVTGRVAAIVNTASGARITIGSLNITIDSSTVVTLASKLSGASSASASSVAALAIGQRVSMYSGSAVSLGSVTASALQIESMPSESSAALRVGGIVREVNPSTGVFSIGRVNIEASQALFTGGSLSDVVVGKSLRVLGTVTASTTNGGVLKASQVQIIKASEDSKIELTGTVSDFLSSSSFKVRNALVDASDSALVAVGGLPRELNDDVLIKVEGILEGNQVKVQKLTFLDASDSRFRAFVGPVAGYQASTGTFSVQGVTSKLLSSTQFRTDGGGTASLSDMVNGAEVTIRGSLAQGVFNVTEVEFEKLAAAKVVKTRGGPYEVNLTARTLKVNGFSVKWDNATQIDGNVLLLKAGYWVEAEGVVSNSVLLASKLKITKP